MLDDLLLFDVVQTAGRLTSACALLRANQEKLAASLEARGKAIRDLQFALALNNIKYAMMVERLYRM